MSVSGDGPPAAAHLPPRYLQRRIDLERERQCFLVHERRIVLERDEILSNLRDHLDGLDGEIVRLGGAARHTLPNGAVEGVEAALANFVPVLGPGPPCSVAPFPRVRRFTGPRTAASAGAAGKGGRQSASGKKRRGRPPKHALIVDANGSSAGAASSDAISFASGARRDSAGASSSSSSSKQQPTVKQEKQIAKPDEIRSNSCDERKPKVAASSAKSSDTDANVEAPNVAVNPQDAVVVWTCTSCFRKNTAALRRCKCYAWKDGIRVRPDSKSKADRVTKKAAAKEAAARATTLSGAAIAATGDGFVMKKKRGRPRKCPPAPGTLGVVSATGFRRDVSAAGNAPAAEAGSSDGAPTDARGERPTGDDPNELGTNKKRRPDGAMFATAAAGNGLARASPMEYFSPPTGGSAERSRMPEISLNDVAAGRAHEGNAAPTANPSDKNEVNEQTDRSVARESEVRTVVKQMISTVTHTAALSMMARDRREERGGCQRRQVEVRRTPLPATGPGGRRDDAEGCGLPNRDFRGGGRPSSSAGAEVPAADRSGLRSKIDDYPIIIRGAVRNKRSVEKNNPFALHSFRTDATVAGGSDLRPNIETPSIVREVIRNGRSSEKKNPFAMHSFQTNATAATAREGGESSAEKTNRGQREHSAVVEPKPTTRTPNGVFCSVSV